MQKLCSSQGLKSYSTCFENNFTFPKHILLQAIFFKDEVLQRKAETNTWKVKFELLEVLWKQIAKTCNSKNHSKR